MRPWQVTAGLQNIQLSHMHLADFLLRPDAIIASVRSGFWVLHSILFKNGWLYGSVALQIISATTVHRPRDDSRRGAVVSGAARWGTTVLRLVGETHKPKNNHAFRATSVEDECTVRMLTEWIITIRHSYGNTAHAYLSHYWQGSSPDLWTIYVSSCPLRVQ